jgi:hypothetical protein
LNVFILNEEIFSLANVEGKFTFYCRENIDNKIYAIIGNLYYL